MSTQQPASDEELRAAYEAELKRITAADVILQTAVSLINLGGRRLGRVPGAEDERDLAQVRDAIDAVRGLMPVLERGMGDEVKPLRDALAQLQMAYAQEAQARPAPEAPAEPAAPGASPSGQPGAPGASPSGQPGAGEAKPDESKQGPGPAEASGRLWVPGR